MSARLHVWSARRLATFACVLLGFGAAGCGIKSHNTSADSEGVYVDAGPITYQVQISRELNPYSAEDRAYLSGVSARAPGANEVWYAIFLYAVNQTSHNAATTNSFDIVDTQGNKYYPVQINPQVNPLAWTPQTLAPSATEPAAGSAASFGATGGSEILFKLNDSIYSNRPLTFQIYAAGQSKPSTVSLDL